jgi:Tubulin-tyrosine ligase family
LFGLDFMIDDELDVKLIEINNNPSLTICSNVTGKLIPKLIDDTFKIVLDPYFDPPNVAKDKKGWDIGDFELIYDSL